MSCAVNGGIHVRVRAAGTLSFASYLMVNLFDGIHSASKGDIGQTMTKQSRKLVMSAMGVATACVELNS